MTMEPKRDRDGRPRASAEAEGHPIEDFNSQFLCGKYALPTSLLSVWGNYLFLGINFNALDSPSTATRSAASPLKGISPIKSAI